MRTEGKRRVAHRTARRCGLPTMLAALAAFTVACTDGSTSTQDPTAGTGTGGGTGPGPGLPPPPPPLELTSISPDENPIDGLGVTLTLRGTGFDSSTQVWFDRGSSGQTRLAAIRVDSSKLVALAPRTLWAGTNTGFGRVYVQRGSATSAQLVFNYYFPCGTGSTTGPYISFAGNANGEVVRDVNNDSLRFRADTRQLVVDGVRLTNVLYQPSDSRVTLDGAAVGRIYRVPSAEGPMIAVICNVDGTRMLDQTRGAVESPAHYSCSAWMLGPTPFAPTGTQANGAQLAGATLAAATLQTSWPDGAPCPAVAIERDEIGHVTVTYCNLVPDRLYVTTFELAGAASPREIGTLPPAHAVPSQFVAAAQQHRIALDAPAATAFVVTITDVSDGGIGCGSFASAAPLAIPPLADDIDADADADLASTALARFEAR